ncbi:MAG: hypothetical protein IPK83_06660 [Planctomycetes bacterium]|nr:hypothetical protein [Planctomycetota bacterium]
MALMKIDFNPSPKTLRTFGIIGLIFFPVLAYAASRNALIFAILPESVNHVLVWFMAALGVYSMLGAVAAPSFLRPLFIGMSYIGVPIGVVVLFTLLAILYYLVITPISLIFKLIGRDAMHRKLEPAATTYWIKRTPTQDVKRYFRQF